MPKATPNRAENERILQRDSTRIDQLNCRLKRHAIPSLIMFAGVLLTVGNVLLGVRYSLARECADILLLESIQSLSELEAALAHRARRFDRAGANYKDPTLDEAAIRLQSFSGLHVWVLYEPDTEMLVDRRLVYFYSEEIDLETLEGAGPRPENYFVIMASVVLPILCWYFAVSKPKNQGLVAKLIRRIAGLVSIITLPLFLLGLLWFVGHFGLLM